MIYRYTISMNNMITMTKRFAGAYEGQGTQGDTSYTVDLTGGYITEGQGWNFTIYFKNSDGSTHTENEIRFDTKKYATQVINELIAEYITSRKVNK